MNKLFSTLFAVVFATSLLAQSGLTCEDAIPVDENYTGTVNGAGVIWYSAWTYDLPLSVHFIPDNPKSDWGPEVQVDFTCVPGVYADRKIDSLINLVDAYDVSFPIEFLCDLVVKDGHNEWNLSVNKSYREQLAEFGIPYNVQAFIKVTYFESGRVTLKPDTAFRNCMESSEYIQLGDTIDVLANDVDRSFVLSYSEWQEDSIRFVWTGDHPATVFSAVQDCGFEPIVSSPFVKETFTLSADAPHKLYSDEMKAAIKNYIGGGLFYGKIISASAGKLVVEKIPRSAAQGGAIELEYDKTIQLTANDQTLYCFPKTWGATQFAATSNGETIAYFAKDDEFAAGDTDVNLISSHPFVVASGASNLSLSTTEMSLITAEATDDYIYVRFIADQPTTITPSVWLTSDCVDESIVITSGKEFVVQAKSYNTIYRLNYAEWKDGDIEIYWLGNGTLPVYISDTCHYYLSNTDAAVVQYDNIRSKNTQLHDSTQVNSWASRVDADGYLYVRFNPTRAGYVTFTSIKPEPEFPPVYTTIVDTLCYGESYTLNGSVYNATGTYTQNFTTANGADSIVTLKLTILPEVKPTTEEVTVEYGENYTWNGVEYAVSGSYTDTLKTIHGCDSVVTLNLTILPNPEKTELFTNDNLVLNLASAFKVYSMDYLAWVAQDVTLNWGGSTPLYVFIAKTKDFALTPYNRYVIHYEEIAAGGSWVLTKEQMASWAAHADADGQIYVRFLTEFEGELIVK